MNSVSSMADRAARSWLGATVRVKGNIFGNGDLLICGTVEGTIKLEEQRLTVGPLANINADITAGEVVTEGFVKGDVRATRRIEIKENGLLIGNITAAQIVIEDGARFKGLVETEPNATKEGSAKNSLRSMSAVAGKV